MSWVANIVSTERPNGVLNIIVAYSEGDNSFQEKISMTAPQGDGWLEQQINNRLTSLNALDTYEQSIVTGPIDVIISITPVESKPTVEEVNRNDFEANYQTLKKMELAITQGLKKETDQDYIDLQSTIKQTFDPSYLDILN